MTTHKNIDKICCVILVLTLIITLLFLNAEKLGVTQATTDVSYEEHLFDTSKVHTINILLEDKDTFLNECADEEYSVCSVVIDNETYKNVAIRAKGNTSLSQVKHYGNNRYSFKIEFDHYDSGNTYYGLDKLCLNNIIQDNTYMKDYLCYQMMKDFGVNAPLCSYAQILINGEEWGLYLAVEGVEESFLERNYGSTYGELYKPDSSDLGGGRGNGKQFDMDNWNNESEEKQNAENNESEMKQNVESNAALSDKKTQIDNRSEKENRMRISSDVSLLYSDDSYESYANIFDNAKTEITDSDKDRLIAALKQLNACDNIEDTVQVEEVIRYFVVHNFVCNFDSYTGSMIHNYYLYEKDGQMSMIPWDYNLAFGGFVGGFDATSLVNYPIDTPVSGGSSEERPMLNWIFENEEYTKLYHSYFDTFLTEYFESGYFSETIDSVKEMIAPYVESDPTKFCTYEEFEKGANTLKEFCLLRAESIRGQLEGSIAASDEEQTKDTLIDASEIQISDMGGMNASIGEEGMGQPPDMENRDNETMGQPPDMENRENFGNFFL